MPCIHGLDEASCPTCRMVRSTIPHTKLGRGLQDLKPESEGFKEYQQKKVDFLEQIKTKMNKIDTNLITRVPKPHLLNQVPDMSNKRFEERLEELDLSKIDEHGISKKMKLENPEWILKKKE